MNKAILLVMKWLNDPSSVSKEDRKASSNANYDAYLTVYNAVSYSTYLAVYNADIDLADRSEFWVDKYFRVSGENKQDYIDELNKNSIHKLVDYIEIYHKGNISSFAREQGVGESQPSRWLKRESYVINGEVYCKVSKQIKQEQQK